MSFQSVSDAELRARIERVQQLIDWLRDHDERRDAVGELLADMEAELARRASRRSAAAEGSADRPAGRSGARPT
jgi:hypothetical protein